MALHLSGPVIVGDADVRAEAWVVDGRVSYSAPHGVRSTRTLDGWVVPGLVDMHCHVGLDGGGAVDPDLALKQALVDRDAGTLLIRDAGAPMDTRFLAQVPTAPRIVRAGRFIARPKRYLRHYAREIEVAELPQAMAEEAARGDGWVKVIADWIDREAGDLTPLWPAGVLAEGVAAAHEAGARVTVHTFAAETADMLLDAGVDCVEHGTGLQREHIEELARRRVPVVPTLLQVGNFEGYAAQGQERFPAYAARMRAMHERRFVHVRDLHESGVPLLVGTDAGGTIGHGALPAEAALMVAAGIPASEVVAMATWRARDFMREPGLEEGAPADLVVYGGDPREDIEALARPRHVMLGGHVV